MTIHSQLAQLEGLCELQRRFNAHVANAREPYRVALFQLMERYAPDDKCCEDADVNWEPKVVTGHGGGDCLPVDWICREHGRRGGVFIPLTLLANQLLA